MDQSMHPSVYFTLPSASLFQFPPSENPHPIAPREGWPRIKAPFTINPEVYHGLLDWKVPVTFVALYITFVLWSKAERDGKPWRISRSRAFAWTVFLHNVALAIFSAVTCIAMGRAIKATLPEWNEDTTFAHYADALCKVNGPRGLGDAVTFNPVNSIWGASNYLVNLAGGTPDRTDVGRLWNEGLAFWGWVFYVSKLYEVMNSIFSVIKGKRVSVMQGLYHAGSIICMWAGIRYMSPPIWFFVLFNSGIQTLMYTYYALTTMNIRLPNILKATLASLQILGQISGAVFAAAHLFVKYDIPITSAYKVLSPVRSASSVVASVMASATSVISSVVHDPAVITSKASAMLASPSFIAVMKRLLLRAAGDQGVAENIYGHPHQRGFGHSGASFNAAQASIRSAAQQTQEYVEETRYNTTIGTIDCLDTSGQVFAVCLNLVYLVPLVYMLIHFFYATFIDKKSSHHSRHEHDHHHHSTTTHRSNKAEQLKHKANQVAENARGSAQIVKEKAKNAAQTVKETAQTVKDTANDAQRKLAEEVQRDLKAVKDGVYRATGKDDNHGNSTPKKETSNSKSTPNGKTGQDTPQKNKDSHKHGEGHHDEHKHANKQGQTSSNDSKGMKDSQISSHLGDSTYNEVRKSDKHDDKHEDSASEDDHSAAEGVESHHEDTPTKSKKRKNKKKKNKSLVADNATVNNGTQNAASSTNSVQSASTENQNAPVSGSVQASTQTTLVHDDGHGHVHKHDAIHAGEPNVASFAEVVKE